MNAEQKQRALAALGMWHSSNDDSLREYQAAELMAGLLQALVDAPTPEPFGYFKAEPFGWTDCAETDDGAIALFAAPPAPSVPDGWRIVPYTPTAQMLERAAYAVNNRPHPSKYELSATPAIIFWTAMLNYAPEAVFINSCSKPPKLSDERILEIWASNSGRPVTMGKARIIAQARAIERGFLREKYELR